MLGLSNPLSAIGSFMGATKSDTPAAPAARPDAPAGDGSSIPANNRTGDRRWGAQLLQQVRSITTSLKEAAGLSGRVDAQLQADGDAMAQDVQSGKAKPPPAADAPPPKTSASPATPPPAEDAPPPKTAGAAPAPALPETHQEALQRLEATISGLHAELAEEKKRTAHEHAGMLNQGMQHFNGIMSPVTSKMLDTSHVGKLEAQLQELDAKIAAGGGTPTREQMAQQALLDQAISSSIQRLIAQMQQMCQLLKTADDNASRLLS